MAANIWFELNIYVDIYGLDVLTMKEKVAESCLF